MSSIIFFVCMRLCLLFVFALFHFCFEEKFQKSVNHIHIHKYSRIKENKLELKYNRVFKKGYLNIPLYKPGYLPLYNPLITYLQNIENTILPSISSLIIANSV